MKTKVENLTLVELEYLSMKIVIFFESVIHVDDILFHYAIHDCQKNIQKRVLRARQNRTRGLMSISLRINELYALHTFMLNNCEMEDSGMKWLLSKIDNALINSI